MPKKNFVLPINIELTQFVSFQAGERCGTVTRFGIVLGFFNGLTVEEFKSVDVYRLSRIVDPSVPPHSKEPHIFVLYEDFAEGLEYICEKWIPLSSLTFIGEHQTPK
jgi:hypothetical protein